LLKIVDIKVFKTKLKLQLNVIAMIARYFLGILWKFSILLHGMFTKSIVFDRECNLTFFLQPGLGEKARA